MSDAVTKRTAEEITEDIGRTRLGLGFIVEALEGRLSMGSLIDEAMGMLRGRPGGAGGGTDAPIGALIKEHPGPAALITAGVVWLAVENRKDAEKGRRAAAKRAPSKAAASRGGKTAAARKSAVKKSGARKKSAG
jgi:hypothetical protein